MTPQFAFTPSHHRVPDSHTHTLGLREGDKREAIDEEYPDNLREEEIQRKDSKHKETRSKGDTAEELKVSELGFEGQEQRKVR